MRRATTVLAVVVLGASAVAIPLSPRASAAPAAAPGSWADWAVSGTTASATFAGTAFPSVSVTSTGQALGTASGASTYLGTRTPVGAVYGSSVNRPYLTAGFSGTPATVTLTFSATPTPGTWAFVLGDVDAEKVGISATDAQGRPVDVSGWHRGSFNSGSGSDAPVWTSPELVGRNADTSGASAWFQPTQPVATITLTQAKLPVGGTPSYQLWLVADAGLGSKVTLCHATSSRTNPYVSVTVDKSAILPRGHGSHTGPLFPAADWGDIIPPFDGYPGLNWPAGQAILDNGCAIPATPTPPPPAPQPVAVVPAGCLTAPELVNGDFEQPVVPRGTFTLLTASQLPGWKTTAPDGWMELWPDGFLGFNAPSGTQILELNAATPGVVYQDVATTPGQVLTWSLMHRARGFTGSGDTMSVQLGAPSSGVTVATFTTPSAAGWVRYSGTYTVPAGQTVTRLSFVTGTTNAGGPLGGPFQGNLIDDVFLSAPQCLPPWAVAPSTPPAPPAPVEVPEPFNSAPIPANPAGPTTIAVPAITGGESVITGAQQPLHGTITATSAEVTYTPDPGYVGPDAVVVQTTTDSGVQATVSTAIEVTPRAAVEEPTPTCTTETTRLATGGFEEPTIPARTFRQLPEARVPGWSTTAPDGLIELWSTGFQGVVAPVGAQFAEINATTDAELYQTVPSVPGQRLTWSLLHRARGAGPAGDTMSVNIGPADGRPNSTTTFTDRLADGWVRHTGTYVVPAGQRETRFGFASGRTASGNRSIGNFIDDIYFTRTACLPDAALDPAPTPPASPPVVAPDRPTTVPVVPPGSGSITAVTPPSHGTAVPSGGDVVYTPTPGYVGPDAFTVEVRGPAGEVRQQEVAVLVGMVQVPVPALDLPATLEPGMTTLVADAVRTNAGQDVAIAVECRLRSRSVPRGDVRLCQVSRVGSSTTLTVTGAVPVIVELVASAPQTGLYLPYRETRIYRVG